MMPIPSDRTITGGAIPIGEPGEVLGVSEGIETAPSGNQSNGANMLVGCECNATG